MKVFNSKGVLQQIMLLDYLDIVDDNSVIVAFEKPLKIRDATAAICMHYSSYVGEKMCFGGPITEDEKQYFMLGTPNNRTALLIYDEQEQGAGYYKIIRASFDADLSGFSGYLRDLLDQKFDLFKQ